MGCDIHLYVERRDGAKWISGDQWETDEDDANRKTVPYKQRFYSDRNYDLFAIFADVRNGRGFAGIRTGDRFVPIIEPRGVPEDCSPEYKAEVDSWGCDGHSHSWLTVADITAFDWTQTTTKRGIVRPAEWAQWKMNGEPRSWSGSIAGRGIMHVAPCDMERAATEVTDGNLWKLFRDGDDFRSGPLGKAVYQKLGGTVEHSEAVTEITWEIPYHHAGCSFLGSVLPRLWRLGPPDAVRVVFFFDN